jgi:hypothetical protein
MIIVFCEKNYVIYIAIIINPKELNFIDNYGNRSAIIALSKFTLEPCKTVNSNALYPLYSPMSPLQPSGLSMTLFPLYGPLCPFLCPTEERGVAWDLREMGPTWGGGGEGGPSPPGSKEDKQSVFSEGRGNMENEEKERASLGVMKRGPAGTE